MEHQADRLLDRPAAWFPRIGTRRVRGCLFGLSLTFTQELLVDRRACRRPARAVGAGVAVVVRGLGRVLSGTEVVDVRYTPSSASRSSVRRF